MNQLLKKEIYFLKNEIKNADPKVLIIFISSIILFTISWYFSNPNYFNELFSFHNTYNYENGELISYCYWFIIDTILFLILPITIIKFIFKEDPKSYGINFNNIKIGFYILGLSLLLFIPAIYSLSISPSFSQYFPLMESATYDVRVFLIYEILFIMFIFSWEFIFRGFILFGLEKKFGIYSIFIQMIPFVLLHNGKPFIETFASIFGAIFLGYSALRTRSIFYGFLIHTFILISLDIIAFFRA